MSGAYKGAQALVRKHSPLALSVHCGAHCTNLVAQDSCDAFPVVSDILQNINALGVLLHQSGKAKRALKDVVASANPDTSIEAIRPLCPTRWTVRVATLQTVMKQLGCILEAKDEIYHDRGDISAKAKGLYTTFSDGTSVLAVLMALSVFETTRRTVYSSTVNKSNSVWYDECCKHSN